MLVLRGWLVVATSLVTCCPIVMLSEEVVVSTGISGLSGIAVKPQKSHISESSRSRPCTLCAAVKQAMNMVDVSPKESSIFSGR